MGFFSNIYDKASEIFGQLKDSAVSTFHNIKNTIKDRGTTLLTGTHYVGPFNSLSDEYIRTHPPTDKIDEGGLQHDKDYSHIAGLRDSGTVSQKEALKLIRDSDLRFLDHMKEHYNANPWASSLGYLGIKGKNILEDIGLIDPNKFVALKIGGKVLAHRLIKK
jgi:hypothetical protein